MKTEQEIKEAIARQHKLCVTENLPNFAPNDGLCFDCRKNIYQDYTRSGWLGYTHITGCPHCNYSFCE